ncbi:MAG: hypothetical protein JW910_21880 [Anaerolineae bacterium]|nr:hypothetical protein [Anaerolineae bacterium]
MSAYFPATREMSHVKGHGLVVVAIFQGANGSITADPVAVSTGWLSHQIAKHKAMNKAKLFAFADAAANKNMVKQVEVPPNARAAAEKDGLKVAEDQKAWVVS